MPFPDALGPQRWALGAELGASLRDFLREARRVPDLTPAMTSSQRTLPANSTDSFSRGAPGHCGAPGSLLELSIPFHPVLEGFNVTYPFPSWYIHSSQADYVPGGLAPNNAGLDQKTSLPSRGSAPGQGTNTKPDVTQRPQTYCLFFFLPSAKSVNEKLKPH